MNPTHDPSNALQGIEQAICFSKEVKKIRHETETHTVKLYQIEKLTERMLVKIEELTKRLDQFEQPPHPPLQHHIALPKPSLPISEPDFGNAVPKRARK